MHIRKGAHINMSTILMVSHERVGSLLSQAMSMLNLNWVLQEFALFAGIRSLIICVDRVDYLDMDQKDFQKLNHVQVFESLHGEN